VAVTALPSDPVVEVLRALRAGEPLPEGFSPLALQVMHRLAICERLAGIGSITDGLAHEINNPLSCVLAAGSALRAELGDIEALAGDAPELKAHFEEMRAIISDSEEGAVRIRELARALREVAHSEDEAVAQADLSEVIASACRLAGAHLKRSAEVHLRLEAGLIVQGAPGRLCQALVNLLVNAAQAMADRAGVANQITITSRRDGDRASVEVADTGPGISGEKLAGLFEPRFAGLGVAISEHLIRGCGGRLRARSVRGEGTTFTLELLAAPDPE
jgi:C4-dicarboxylate-specific signal transduction histidine kinase